MRAPLRFALVGAGFIGNVHARSARLAGGHLVGVAAGRRERAKEAAAELGAERTFADPQEVAEAKDVDVVHICTPNHLHAPYARAALEAGKHVICEKPLGLSPTEAEELTELARQTDRVAAIPFVYRYYPTVREARVRVADGSTGPLHLIHGSYQQDWMSRQEDYSWRVDPDLGGPSRAFADIGSHWCDLMEFVSGHHIVAVTARTNIVLAERQVSQHAAAFSGTDGSASERTAVATEDAAVMLFETDRGARGSLAVSQVSPGRKNRLWIELNGTSASLAFNQEEPESLWIGGRESSTVLHRDPAVLHAEAARLSALPPGHPQGYHDCFDYFVADAYAAILGNQPEGLPTFDDGLRATRITQALLDAATSSTWTEVPS